MSTQYKGPLVVGVDVGGTNTDSVLLDLSRPGTSAVISFRKSQTTSDVTSGIEDSLTALLSKTASSSISPPDPSSISALAIGTTHFLNAIIQRDASRLSRVAIIRLGSHGFVQGALPFADWPRSLRSILEGYSAIVPGGVNIDGKIVAPLDENSIRREARKIHELGLRHIVVNGMGSPMDQTYHQEDKAKEILLSELEIIDPSYAKNVHVVLSHTIAGSGFLTRENASIMNAGILSFARQTIHSFVRAMTKVGLKCPLYLTSNAGHLLPSSEVLQFPIRIFSSGATNSMRGAAFLAREELAQDTTGKGCLVIDIGGTTSDVGALMPNGYPRLSRTFTELAGVKINLDMPSVESIGLGGGSIVRILDDQIDMHRVTVGPDSVGHALTTEAFCFGGIVATATDAVVASSPPPDEAVLSLPIGDPSLVSLSREAVLAARIRIKHMLESLVDRIKLSPEDCTVVLVGGGAILCPPELKGVSRIIRSEHAGVANAIGAALAKICGSAEALVDADDLQNGIAKVKKLAIENARAKGGVPEDAIVLHEQIDWVPYVDNKKFVRLEVACSADHGRAYAEMLKSHQTTADLLQDQDDDSTFGQTVDAAAKSVPEEDETDDVDLSTYRPTILPTGEWLISPTDLKFLEIGCYILGCGGGGSPYASYLNLMELLRQGERITVVRTEDLKDDDVVPAVAAIGTPAVGLERISSGAVFHALKRMSKEMDDVQFTHILATEIGGMNGLGTLQWGAKRHLGRPIVDADLMGRAFPNFEMVSQYITTESINELLPVAICSGDGQDVIVPAGQEDETAAGKEIRKVCARFGFAAGAAGRPLTGKKLKEVGVPNTLSLAWHLGRAVRRAQVESTLGTVTDALIAASGGPKSARRVFTGKIRGVETKITETGHSLGEVVIEALADDEIETEAERGADGEANTFSEVRVPFMNENLAVIGKGVDGDEILATVPDLIMLLDVSTGEAIGVQEYRYGVKVVIMIMAPHPIWATKRGLEVAGPSAFQLPYKYQSGLEYTKPRSIIDEFSV